MHILSTAYRKIALIYRKAEAAPSQQLMQSGDNYDCSDAPVGGEAEGLEMPPASHHKMPFPAGTSMHGGCGPFVLRCVEFDNNRGNR
jgi:hypothetical protein